VGQRGRALADSLACEAYGEAAARTSSGSVLLAVRQDDAMTRRELVSSGAIWEPVVGYSRAVRVGQWVSVAGTTAAAAGGGAVGGDDVGAQAREALRRVVAALEEVGAGPEHVVRTRIYVTDISRWEEVGRAHGEVFGEVRPATSMVEVSRLIDAALLVEIEADAVVT
jgi:enamine deaminase RidA (YjgF/YER057c/UK114 family)